MLDALSVSIRQLSNEESLRFADMTYPTYWQYLGAPGDREFRYVGAEADGVPAGLAFGVADREKHEWYEVVGLAAQSDGPEGETREKMLRLLMSLFAASGRRRAVFHPTFDAGDKVTVNLLRRCGWTGPFVRQISASTTVDKMFGLPSLFKDIAASREGYEVLPWAVVDAPLRQRISDAIKELPAPIRGDIDPFIYEGRAVPDFSFVMLRGGEPIGWHLPERFDEATMRWTCSAVLPGKWSMAAVFQLWKHALTAQRDMGIPRLIWGVPVAHPNQVRFITTRLRPFLDSLRVTATFGLALESE